MSAIPLQTSSRHCRIVEHPLLGHNLAILRDAATTPIEFRRVMNLLSSLLVYEAARDFETQSSQVATPCASAEVSRVTTSCIIVSILRSGNGMIDGMTSMLPFASVGHIGIYNDRRTRNTIEYYFRLPPRCEGRTVLVADPFIGSGKTATAAIDRLREYDVGEIRFITLMVSPEGVERIHEAHPDVTIYTLSVEQGLNEDGLLVPGVGDAGERLFGGQPG